MTAFEDFGLDERILKAITQMGFETPTPIQVRSIPVLLEGNDVIGRSSNQEQAATRNEPDTDGRNPRAPGAAHRRRSAGNRSRTRTEASDRAPGFPAADCRKPIRNNGPDRWIDRTSPGGRLQKRRCPARRDVGGGTMRQRPLKMRLLTPPMDLNQIPDNPGHSADLKGLSRPHSSVGSVIQPTDAFT